MPWPLSQDYNEAIQTPAACFGDPELKQGEAVTNALGIPMPRSGNFADVYEFNCPVTKKKWAVKCFTRQIPGLHERYVQIDDYLQQVPQPFMVGFNFLEQGMRIRGDWYPILKMQWVEGFALNDFVKQKLDKPQYLELLCQIWVKMAKRLREANLAHCDLQHGNVLLVPGRKEGALAVKLVDYDGMCVPALTLLKSIEVGHPNFQHPRRAKERIYNLEVDRFSHLVIYTALKALQVGGRPLWDKYDNGDNLLFKQADLEAPGKSALFAELLRLSDPTVNTLTDILARAAAEPLEEAPLLEELTGAGMSSATAVRAQPADTAVPSAVKTQTPAATDTPVAPAAKSADQRQRKWWRQPVKTWAAALIILAVVATGAAGVGTWFLKTRARPPAPDLLAPLPGATLPNGIIAWQFQWSEVPHANQYKLTIQSPLAVPPLTFDLPQPLVSHRSGFIDEANRQGWRWKVAAQVNGNWSEWSEERTFNVQPLEKGPAPSTPPGALTRGPTYVNTAARYSLILPEGWKLMPQPQLDKYMKFLEENGQKQEYVAGFQLSARKDFQHPYILVQQYELETPSYAEIVKKFESQYPPGKTTSKSVVDKNRKMISCTIELDGIGLGKEKRLAVMCLGKKAVTCLTCYALDSEYAKYAPVFDAILSSFKFDDGEYVEIKPKPKVEPPALLLPAAGAVVDNGAMDESKVMAWDFQWSEVKGASQYHLRVSEPGQANPVLDQSILTSPSYRHETRGYIANENRLGWRWQVRALVNGTWTDWSPERSFDVQPFILPKEITNSIGMKLVLIPKGKFLMGSPSTEKGHEPGEGPQHEVELAAPFYMGAHEVTQEEYERVMEYNPSNFSAVGGGKDKVKGMDTRRFPVDMVSWEDASAFCRQLSELPEEKKLGRVYRLPTEAEWEYACRAGTTTPFHFGNTLAADQAIFDGNNPYGAVKGKSPGKTAAAGSHPPNAFGLFDMHGNVAEWCSDWHDKGYYANSPKQDPRGPQAGKDRVVRGGAWNTYDFNCRAAARRGYVPGSRLAASGFRIVWSLSPSTSPSEPPAPPVTKVEPPADGQELLTLKGHTRPVVCVSFSPDGKRLASASYDKTVKIWNTITGQELFTFKGHSNTVYCVCFSSDGKRLASACLDGTVKVWNASSGQEFFTLTGHTRNVWSVCFSPDSKRLASASEDKTVKIWNAANGQELLTFKGHTQDLLSVCFSPDGKRLASASGDGTVKVWNAASGQELLTFKGHTDIVRSVCFSPDGKRLASANGDDTVRVWDTASGQELLTLKGHTGQVCSVCFSPDGKRLASASLDKTVKLWNAASGQEYFTFKKGHDDGIPSVCFSPDGKRLASTSADNTVKVWSVAGNQESLIAPATKTDPSSKQFTNSIGMKLVLIPKGKFTMGSPASEKNRDSDEGPQHEVEITKPFYAGAYEVTQEEYEQVTGTNPSQFKGKRNPVEQVSYNDVVEFCKKLSALPEEKRAGRVYRLLTEAEWEYACRGGSGKAYCYGDDAGQLQEYGWYSNNSDSKTHPVGTRKPNAFGLHDMHGNVWEWCADWYDEGYYKQSPAADPRGPAGASHWVIRGGGWDLDGGNCRSASRDRITPDRRLSYLGFRVAAVQSR